MVMQCGRTSILSISISSCVSDSVCGVTNLDWASNQWSAAQVPVQLFKATITSLVRKYLHTIVEVTADKSPRQSIGGFHTDHSTNQSTETRHKYSKAEFAGQQDEGAHSSENSSGNNIDIREILCW